MKIRVEVDKSCPEDEIIIRCAQRNDAIERMYGELQELSRMQETILFYKDHAECFIRLSSVLFFETDGREVHAHTAADVYRTDKRLYELEELLPKSFMRISKSTILNLQQVGSLERTLSAACTVSFQPYEKRTHFLGIVFPFGSRARRPQPILAVRGDLADPAARHHRPGHLAVTVDHSPQHDRQPVFHRLSAHLL